MKNNFKIKKIKAREILDSRGEPTVEVNLETDFGIFSASVPSGTSKGKYEAVELRDGARRYKGRGVQKAVNNINKVIAQKLKGEDFTQQKKIDEILISLDGTKNKSNLGANAILPVSVACCRAGARANNISLWQYISQMSNVPPSLKLQRASKCQMSKLKFPTPCFNVINGGAHAGNNLDIQEFMIVPQLEKFSDNLEAVCGVYHTLKEILQEKYGESAINVGDEGGFAPPISKTKEALDLIMVALESEHYSEEVKIGLDCAANEYLIEARPLSIYEIEGEKKNTEELLEYYQELIKKYPIIFLEDPFAEDDFEGWQLINSKFKIQNSKLLIIGDDLTATNLKRIKLAYQKKACNAMILKLNQIGTISEVVLEAAKLAKDFGWKIIVSHRSGETCDDFIADLAVGISADFIKSGAPARGERMAKYNRLLRIEEEIQISKSKCQIND